MRPIDTFVHKIARKPIFHKEFFAKLRTFKDLEDIEVEDIDTLRLLGLPLTKYNNYAFTLETVEQSIACAKFCIVDIETNGSKPEENQIIEIGAVMLENGKEISTFSSLVQTQTLPENIEKLTGISLSQLQKAPSLKSVLEAFRLFLQDAIFVAHNVNFDYFFISTSLQKAGFGPLLNRRICTIDLAKKTIVAPKYGLSALMEHLQIPFENHHRALSDAKATSLVFLRALEHIPKEVTTVEGLILFAKPQPKKPKKEKKSTNTSP